MKTLFTLMLIVLTLSSATHSQVLRGYGIKAGVTVADQDWHYPFNWDPDNRTGFNAGVFAEFLNHPFFSVVTELNYVQKGMMQEVLITTEEYPEGTKYMTWENRIDYLNVSALAKLRLNYGIVKPYLLAGPKIDFEIGKHLMPYENVPKRFPASIYGFKVGLGTELNLMGINFLAEFVYDSDLKDLYKSEFLTVNSKSYEMRLGILL